VDIDSWIDYYALELYIANTDWPNNNRSLWRVRNVENKPDADGKWRWVMFDVNLSMNPERAEDNFITRTTKRDPIFSSLIDNLTFKKALYARMVDFANDTFNPERVNAFVDDYAARMRHAMGNEYKRFMHDKTEEDFLRSCEDIKAFFQLRHDIILEVFGGK
jgi:hypothetical protein